MEETTQDDEWVFIPCSEFNTTLGHLPEEMLLRIFFFLGPKDLCTLASVSRAWRALSEDDSLWCALYQVAKENHLLEARRRRPLYDRSGWKLRYRESFHIPKGLFGFTLATDSVEICLDENTFISGGSGVVSGEVVLHVASSLLLSPGVYLLLRATERIGGVQRSGSMSIRLLKMRIPVHGNTKPWDKGGNSFIGYTKGTHRIPFSFLFPTEVRDTQSGNILSETANRVSLYFAYNVCYRLVARLEVKSWSYKRITSRKVPLWVVPDPEQRLQALQEGSIAPVSFILLKDLFFGGYLSFDIELEKTVFYLGERIRVHLDIDSRASYYEIRSVRLSLEERLEWTTDQSSRASISRGTQVIPVSVPAGRVTVLDLEYFLDWEDVQGTTILLTNTLKQQYLFTIEFVVPLPAFNPKKAVPIQIFRDDYSRWFG